MSNKKKPAEKPTQKPAPPVPKPEQNIGAHGESDKRPTTEKPLVRPG